MEGDIITTQDVFLFDYAAGVDEDGKFQGGLNLDRPATPLPRAAHGPRRHVDPAVFATGRRDEARRLPAARRCDARRAGSIALVGRTAGARRPTRSTSTTSSPRTGSPCSWPSTASRRQRRRPRDPVGQSSTATRATRRPRPPHGRHRAHDRARARREQQHAEGRQVRRRDGAVDAFLERAPPDVRIGLVTFAGDVASSHRAHHRPRGRPRRGERARADPAGTERLRRDRRGPATRSGHEGLRARSSSSPTERTPAARTTLDVASPRRGGRRRRRGRGRPSQGPAKSKQISTLADATGGRCIPADPDALSSGLSDAQADALAQQLVVSLRGPDGVDGEASVDARRHRRRQTFYTDSAFVSLGRWPSTLLDVVKTGKALVSTPVMLRERSRVFLGLGGRPRRRSSVPRGHVDRGVAPRRLLRRRPIPVAGSKRRTKQAQTQTTSRGSPRWRLTDKVVNADLETRDQPTAAGAGSALTASEWLLLHAGDRGRSRLHRVRQGWPAPRRPRTRPRSRRPVALPQVPARSSARRLQRTARRDARPDGGRPPGRTLAAAGGRHASCARARADGRRASARTRRATTRRRHHRRPRKRR